jgi:hypothetical protein
MRWASLYDDSAMSLAAQGRPQPTDRMFMHGWASGEHPLLPHSARLRPRLGVSAGSGAGQAAVGVGSRWGNEVSRTSLREGE